MKHLRRIGGGFFLVLALSIPAFAGDIHSTDIPGPSVAGDISCPGIAGEIGLPGINLILSILF